MDIDQLTTFQILAREAHFGRAAAILGVSQPTVTFRIKSLEEELDLPLVKRIGPIIKLTDEGEKLLSYVNRLMRILQETKDQIHALKHSDAPKLSIVGSSNINTFLLPDLLTEFKKRHPEWQLSIYTGTRKSIVEMVKDKICHLGFIRGPLADPELDYIPLIRDRIDLVVPNGHRLARHSSVSLKEIGNEPILSYRFDPMIRIMFEQYSIETDNTPNIIMELENVITVKKMLLAGMGIAFLNQRVIKEELAQGSVVALPIEGSSIEKETGIIYVKSHLSAASQTFSTFLQESFDKK